MSVCVRAFTICVCVCVCEREREREKREREGDGAHMKDLYTDITECTARKEERQVLVLHSSHIRI